MFRGSCQQAGPAPFTGGVRTILLLAALTLLSSVALASRQDGVAGTADPSSTGSREAEISLLLQQSDRAQRDGHPARSFARLQQAEQLAGSLDDPEPLIRIRIGLGVTHFLIGDLDLAAEQLEQALSAAEAEERDDLLALTLLNLGNVDSGRGEHQQALTDYSDAMALAESAGLPLLQAKAAINAGRVARILDDPEAAIDYANQAGELLDTLETSHEQLLSLLAVANLLRDIAGSAQRLRAFDYYQKAVKRARAATEQYLLANALGSIGALYERESRITEALDYTGRSLLVALQIDRPDLLFRLQWQFGRLLAAMGSEERAIVAYRQAVTTLAGVRRELISGPVRKRISFKEFVGDLYYELADLLLRRSSRGGDQQRLADLLAARDTVEQLKAVEMEDYFQDECVTRFQSKRVAVDSGTRPGTAVLYPLILKQRLELLLTLPGGIERFSVPVSAIRLAQEAWDLREALEAYTGDEYLPYAQQLYEWLIRPLQARLATNDIDTLVFVPDGALRMIPIAALHDGEQFLVSRYATAITPGLMLTDAKPLDRTHPKILMSGITDSVQGFVALPAVGRELEDIGQLYAGKTLKNKAFSVRNFAGELEKTPYTIVHLSTHAQIDRDVRKSFLLTYDDRLTMDDLEEYIGLSRYRTAGVELLTLSACETALGDDRAALGLAGIALKAGARSALATIWSVSDDATALLVPKFYSYLADATISKARALQRAQQLLLATDEYAHPGYWAPFLLIGNWL